MTPADQKLIDLQRRYDDLSARVAAVEEGIVGTVEPLMLLGLSLSEAQILALLMKRQTVPKETVYFMLYGGQSENPPQQKILDVWLCRLRKRFAPLGVKINSRIHFGWSIAPNHKNIINALIRENAASNAAASGSPRAFASAPKARGDSPFNETEAAL